MTSLFLAIFVGLVSVTGIAINAYIIFFITLAKQVNSVNGMLLVQTSAVELALSVSVLTCSLPNMIRDYADSASVGYCTACGFIVGLLRPVAVWTVCGLNCDRYYAISAPLHYGSLVNSRKVLTAMCATWISSLILGLPAAISGVPYTYNNASFSCVPNFGNTTFSVYYSILHTIIAFVLPLVLILTCNMRVFTIARYHKHRIASAIFEVALSAQVTITHQKNPFSPSGLTNRFKGRSASLAVIQLVGSFLVVYGPYFSAVLWDATSVLLVPRHLQPAVRVPSFMIGVASVLLFCSSSMNGILYGVKSKVLKKSFQNYWRKKMTKNELNQEIQARTPSTCGSRRPSLTPAVSFFGRQGGGFRRPSEASIDTQKSNLLATSYPRFQQGINSLVWRPGSSPGLESSSAAAHHAMFDELKRSHSFRVANHVNSLTSLKLPVEKVGKTEATAAELHASLRSTTPKSRHPAALTGNGATMLLHRFRKGEAAVDYEALSKVRSKSPKILITRAFSEENESTADRSTVPKTSSSVTTLLIDSSWKSMSRECIAFNASVKSNALLMDYTDESSSEESQDETNERRRRQQQREKVDPMDSDSSAGYHGHSIRSWPFTSKRRNIKFRIGSVVLSEHDFSSMEEADGMCQTNR